MLPRSVFSTTTDAACALLPSEVVVALPLLLLPPSSPPQALSAKAAITNPLGRYLEIGVLRDILAPWFVDLSVVRQW